MQTLIKNTVITVWSQQLLLANPEDGEHGGLRCSVGSRRGGALDVISNRQGGKTVHPLWPSVARGKNSTTVVRLHEPHVSGDADQTEEMNNAPR